MMKLLVCAGKTIGVLSAVKKVLCVAVTVYFAAQAIMLTGGLLSSMSAER